MCRASIVIGLVAIYTYSVSTINLQLIVYVGILAVPSLLVGNAVKRIIDANPSLCISDPMNEGDVNATNDTTEYATSTDTELQIDYQNCPASVDIAVTMTFVYALLMVSI